MMLNRKTTVIFIIDNNPANVVVLSRILKSSGYKTLGAMDGLSGIQKITNSLPDLILLDIFMPELDGFEICRLLKKSKITRDIPIIFMTAFASNADKVKGLSLGAVDYVTKPFKQEELIARLEIHLKLYRLGQDLIKQNQQLQLEISQRKQLEERLKILSQVLEKSSASVMITNKKGDIEYVNSKFEELVGYALEDVIGQNVRILESGNTPDREYSQLGRLNSMGEEWHGEIHNRKPNGELYWEQTSISSIKDADSQITHYITVKEDITRRKQNELDLYQQLEREKVVADLTLSIRHSLDLSVILNTAVAELRRILNVDRVLVYCFMPDGSGKMAAESVNDQLESILDIVFPVEVFPLEMHRPYIEGRIYQVDNIECVEVLPCILEFFKKLGIKAKLVAPIVQNESLWGLLVAQHSQPHHWQSWEPELLHQVSNQMAIAISQSYLYQQVQTELAEKIQAENALQLLNQELENRVEQRTAELKQSELRFRRLFESDAAGVFIAKMSGQILKANNRYLQMIGYTQEDVENSLLDWNIITPSEFRVREEIALHELRDLGFTNPFEKEYICRDGNRLPVLISSALIDNEREELVVIVIDISDRKNAEAEILRRVEREGSLREINQRIRESLELPNIFNAVVLEIKQLLKAERVSIFYFYPESNFSDGVFVAEDMQECLVSTFEKAISTDCGKEFALNYQSGQIEALSDIAKANLKDSHRQLLQQFEVQADLVVPILQGIKAENLWGLICIHQCSRPRQWEQFEIEFVAQIAAQLAIAIQQADLYHQVQIELTERKQIEAQLQKNNEQLEIANIELARATRLKDEFLANMSHELRTPLNAILGMSEALQEGIWGELSEQQKNAISTIESGGKHLLELITDILDLAKIESGKLELHLENIEIEKLCNDSLVFVKQLAHKKNIKLIFNISDRLKQPQFIYIHVDELRMRQALINLLTNAVKFTPDGGTVTLETQITEIVSENEQHKTYIDFLVIDTGIGIAPEDIGKLFQTFVQIDSALNRKYTGTGLGLSLVKKIVEMHGGLVDIESEVNKGSKFRIRLSHQPDLVTNTISNVLPSMTEILEVSGNRDTPYKILIVDDNTPNMETICGYLESRNYRLCIATNGKIAVDLAISQKPDIILMDIQMPEMDGLTAIKLIRANPEVANIPIIVLTALAMSGDRERCIEAGANEYLAKPFKLKVLFQLIQNNISNVTAKQKNC